MLRNLLDRQLLHVLEKEQLSLYLGKQFEPFEKLGAPLVNVLFGERLELLESGRSRASSGKRSCGDLLTACSPCDTGSKPWLRPMASSQPGNA
ncbi:MAG: hypothetical protein U5N86_00985 [Planctomycetota bacterium]|nr:hypothetical protein [Planctomycetota bacterium]